MSKTPSISQIFDKNKEGSYTSKALLYQDIIRYSLTLIDEEKALKVSYLNRLLIEVEDHTSLKVWDLTRWLLDHNTEFKNSRRDPSNRNKSRSNLIEDRMDRVKKSVAALCSLQIMDERGQLKQEKGEGRVQTYGFTFYGYLLALIMESTDPAKQAYCEKMTYDLWQAKLQHDNSPVDIFTSIIFIKYKQKGVFREFVLRRIVEFLNSESVIETMTDVIESISVIHASYEKVNVFIDLWQKTWDELDSQTREKLLYHFKTELELRMSNRAHWPKEYEEHRFNLRNDLEVIALEAMCKNCSAYQYASVKLVPYLRKRKIIQSGPMVVTCTECGGLAVELPSL